MRIFGKKGKDRPESGDEQAHRAPDEHTRLLPNRLNSENRYLSPDDPAVSPYNLWNVRFTRYATIILSLITFVWWTIQLISTFVTPPFMYTRGPIFYSFGFATIALLLLGATLLFFTASAKSFRLLCLVMSGLLVVDLILTLAVDKVRHEERWVGALAIGWTLLMAFWAVVVDRTVQWGKTKEEERLTGRPETRRTLGEWTEVALSSVIIFAIDVAVFLMTLNMILRAVDAGLAPPGERYWVDVNKYQIHLYCHENKTNANGTERPTVLIEGGEGTVENELWQFADNAIKNGSINRYCFADRPGFAWSDNAPSPLSMGMATDALSEALAKAHEAGPWVLLSAGVGSAYSRIFFSRHGREVTSLVMIDPLHEDLLSRLGSTRRGFSLWLWGIISPLGIIRITGALLRGRTRVDRVWGRSCDSDGRFLFAKLQEQLVANSLSKRELISSREIQDQKTPVVLISSGEKIKEDSEWEAKQRDLSHLTDKVDWDIVDRAPHEVWRTLEGRELIERRLRELVHKKSRH